MNQFPTLYVQLKSTSVPKKIGCETRYKRQADRFQPAQSTRKVSVESSQEASLRVTPLQRTNLTVAPQDSTVRGSTSLALRINPAVTEHSYRLRRTTPVAADAQSCRAVVYMFEVQYHFYRDFYCEVQMLSFSRQNTLDFNMSMTSSEFCIQCQPHQCGIFK